MNATLIWLFVLLGFAKSETYQEEGKLSDDFGFQQRTGECERRISFINQHNEYLRKKNNKNTYDLSSTQEIVVTSDCQMTIRHEMIDGEMHIYIETKRS